MPRDAGRQQPLPERRLPVGAHVVDQAAFVERPPHRERGLGLGRVDRRDVATVRVKTISSSGSMTTCSASHSRRVRRAIRLGHERRRGHIQPRDRAVRLAIPAEVAVAGAGPQVLKPLVHATRTSMPALRNGRTSTFSGWSSSKPGRNVLPQAAYFPPAARLYGRSSTRTSVG